MPRGVPWKVTDPFNTQKGLLRLSWNKFNLYNLHQKKLPDLTNMSVFKQKWTAKKELRSYHFPNIPIRQFLERHFDTHLPTQALSRKDQESAPPAQALLFAKLERRLDVALFRGHFCRSLWAARRAVTTGNVKVNGVKCEYPAWELKDGDMVTIDPSVVSTLVHPKLNDSPTSTESKETDKKKKQESKAVQKEGATPMEFKAQPYMSPWMFTPAYLEVDYNTCSLIFLRSPLPQPSRMEIPSPFPPSWHQLVYDWFATIKKRKVKFRTKEPLVLNDRLVKLKPKFDKIIRSEMKHHRVKKLQEKKAAIAAA